MVEEKQEGGVFYPPPPPGKIGLSTRQVTDIKGKFYDSDIKEKMASPIITSDITPVFHILILRMCGIFLLLFNLLS